MFISTPSTLLSLGYCFITGVLGMIVCLAIVAVSYFAVRMLLCWRALSPKEPPVLMGWSKPWLGVALEYSQKPQEFLLDKKRELGKVFSMYVAGELKTVVLDPSWHPTFFRATARDMLFFEPLNSVRLPEVLGFAFCTERAEGLMHVIKVRMQPQYQHVVPTLVKDTARVLEELMPGESGVIDLCDLSDHMVIVLSLRVLCRTMAEDAALITDLKMLEVLAHELLVNPGILGMGVLRKVRPIRVRVVAKLRAELERRKAGGEVDKSDYVDLMSLMMDASEDDNMIIDAVVGMMFGAVANTNAAIVLSICHITFDPLLCAQLRSEAELTLGEDKYTTLSQIQSATAVKLPLLDAVLMEVTRIYSIVLSLRRLVKEHEVVGGYVLPAGRTVAISNNLAMRDPELFPNPLLFDPRRFLEDEDEECVVDGASGNNSSSSSSSSNNSVSGDVEEDDSTAAPTTTPTKPARRITTAATTATATARIVAPVKVVDELLSTTTTAITDAALSAASTPTPIPPQRQRAQREVQRRAYAGFGSGVHMCKGMGLARTELRLIVTLMLQSYDIKPLPECVSAADGVPPLQWVSLGLAKPTSQVLARYVRK